MRTLNAIKLKFSFDQKAFQFYTTYNRRSNFSSLEIILFNRNYF